MPPNWRLLASALVGLLAVGQAYASPGDDTACSVALSGQQNIWDYVPHIEKRCSADNVLEFFILSGELDNAVILAAMVCRFDRSILFPSRVDASATGICVYRGSARTPQYVRERMGLKP
jgi:hypothetical protein